MPEEIDLEHGSAVGTCCACGSSGPTVRNLLMLHFKAPVPGTGWGCCACKTPADGAMAVVCDDCCTRNTPPQFVISGEMVACGRAPIADFEGGPHHDHDKLYHPEIAERRIRKAIEEGRRP